MLVSPMRASLSTVSHSAVALRMLAGLTGEKGVQFHPEVAHTPSGSRLLKNFAVDICGATPSWAMSKFVDQEISHIRKLVGETDHVLGAVSGGVDSTVYVRFPVLVVSMLMGI